jgi:hypothetical protein
VRKNLSQLSLLQLIEQLANPFLLVDAVFADVLEARVVVHPPLKDCSQTSVVENVGPLKTLLEVGDILLVLLLVHWFIELINF